MSRRASVLSQKNLAKVGGANGLGVVRRDANKGTEHDGAQRRNITQSRLDRVVARRSRWLGSVPQSPPSPGTCCNTAGGVARGLMLCCLAATTSGCIYSSQVKKDTFRTPQHFASQASKAPTKAKIGRWWELFGDADLNRLVELAFTQSLDLEVARARLEQSRARLMAATAGWLPTITGTAEVSRSQTVFNLPEPIGAKAFRQDNFQLSLSASYELDLWGKVRYGRKAAIHALQSSEQALRAVYVSLAAGVADAYYLLVQQRMQQRLLQQTIENRTKQLQLVRDRYRAGVARPAELYQAQQSLTQTQAQLAQIRGTIKTSAHALAVLIGRYPGEIDPGGLDELPQPIKEIATGVPGNLLLQRPDLQAAFRQLQATDAQVGAALAEHFPSINLSASLGERFDPTGFIWNLLGQLTAPIFAGGRIHAQYRERQALLREGIATFKQTLMRAVTEVEDALVRGRALSKRIQWLQARVEASEGALRLSTDQYVQGLSQFLDVLTSEGFLFAARTDLIAARRELISARVSLARALGGSWMDDAAKRLDSNKTSKDNPAS